MNLTGPIAAIIANNAAAHALLDGRVYAALAPQNPAYPLAVVTHVGNDPKNNKNTPSPSDYDVVQIDVYGTTLAQCAEAAEAVRRALDYFRGNVVYQEVNHPVETIMFRTWRHNIEEEPRVHRYICEYMVIIAREDIGTVSPNPVGLPFWPLLAPDGGEEAPSYAFLNSPKTGLFLLPGRFSALNLRLQAASRVGLPGVGIVANAGSSDTANGGSLTYRGGDSDNANGGNIDFIGGLSRGTNPLVRGGNITFSGGSAPEGIGGDVRFAPGNGGSLIFFPLYVPTSSSDPRGERGSFALDDNYIYFKSDTQWKRVALSTF